MCEAVSGHPTSDQNYTHVSTTGNRLRQREKRL